jgi:hypothetical protein
VVVKILMNCVKQQDHVPKAKDDPNTTHCNDPEVCVHFMVNLAFLERVLKPMTRSPPQPSMASCTSTTMIAQRQHSDSTASAQRQHSVSTASAQRQHSVSTASAQRQETEYLGQRGGAPFECVRCGAPSSLHWAHPPCLRTVVRVC